MRFYRKHIFIFLLIINITPNTIYAQKSNTKKPKIKNVILMIGDGMGVAQIYAGLTAKKDNLQLERCKHIGFSKTSSSDDYVTDSAAGATALSIGQKTYNGAIGVDTNKNPQPTILEIAEKQGLATGLVATCAITHATPGSFIAHQPSRKMEEEIAADFLKTDVDVFIGGGKKYFDQRKDKKNILEELKKNNYQVVEGIDAITQVKSGKLAGFTANDQPPKMSEGRGNMLSRSTQTALQILKQNKKGFFLLVEGSQIDWGGHNNDSDYIVQEMVDFDNVIGEVLDFAQKDGETLVIITADHETGGYALVGGDLKTGKVEGKFITDHHTAVMVPVFAYGPGAEAFMGIYQNNTIFDKMMKALGFRK